MLSLYDIENIKNHKLLSRRWNTSKKNNSSLAGGILVTGANSFLGTHILNELMQTRKGKIFALIRANSNTEATRKLKKSFQLWIKDDFQLNELEVLHGDTGTNMFGLDLKTFETLKNETACVIHLAMNPISFLPFEHYKRFWIPELSRMISFCADKQFPKSLHYPSCLNVNYFNDVNGLTMTNTNLWQSGLAAFKWFAEKAIRNAFSQGLHGTIYEIPMIFGSEANGVCPRNYAFWKIFDLFIRANSYTDFSFRIIPVDVLAKVMAANITIDKEHHAAAFLRPVLKENLDNELLGKTVSEILGMKYRNAGEFRNLIEDKESFDFLFPPDFLTMQEKVNKLESIFPESFDKSQLPSTAMIMLSNINKMLKINKNKIFQFDNNQ